MIMTGHNAALTFSIGEGLGYIIGAQGYECGVECEWEWKWTRWNVDQWLKCVSVK